MGLYGLAQDSVTWEIRAIAMQCCKLYGIALALPRRSATDTVCMLKEIFSKY